MSRFFKNVHDYQGARRPRIAKGAQDIDPKRMIIRDYLFSVIQDVFSRYGAVAIDTPIFELKVICGRYWRMKWCTF